MEGASDSRPYRVGEPADLSLPFKASIHPVVSDTDPAREKRKSKGLESFSIL